MTDTLNRLKTALSDRYTIERELGSGGMATVYLAGDLKHHRKVAVKVLRPDLAAALGAERFVREIEIAAGLTHPHIVPLYDSGDADGFLYYVLPYIEGESLREKLAREGELPIADAVRILRDVVDALSDAHAHGVVHRDIKPDNVMLTKHHAVVTDFGVAKAVSEATGREKLTTVGVALGTPSYMAPEQAAADPNIDPRADIYAVGALAYELLTGRPPFVGATPQMILSAHVTEAPDPVTKHRQAVPPALAALVMKCLEKKRGDRWQSAEELVPQLEALATPSGGITPTGTMPVAAVDYDALSRQAHPARVAALFGVASAGVLGIVYLIMLQLGLPDWVFLGAIALLAIGLPIMLVTGHHERQRALAQTTGVAVTMPANGMPRLFTWRRSFMGGGLAFAGLVVAVSGYSTMRAMGIGPAGTLITTGVLEERGLLIVAEFEDRTPEANVAQSVTEAFRIDLSQSPSVRLMDASAIQQALARMSRHAEVTVDASLAREIARREGVNALVAGDVGMLGTSFVISVRLLAAEDGTELLALREQAKDAAALVDAVDRLSAELRRRIGESLKTIRAGDPLARVTTSSLEALRVYTLSDRVAQAGDWERAIGLLEEAIAHDSTFAMAYRRLAILLSNAARERSRINAATTRAFELRDRLPPVERYLATALFHSQVMPDLDKNIDAYQSVLEIDPENRPATNNLALAFLARRRFAEAEALFRRGIAQAPIWQNYNGLITALVPQERWQAAESTVVEFDRWSPGDRFMLRNAVHLAAARHDYATADSVLLKYLAAGGGAQGLFLQAGLSEVRGRLAAAARVAADRVADADREGNGLDVLRWAIWPIRHDVLYRDPPDAAVRNLEITLDRYPLDMAAAADRPYAAMADIYGAAGRAEMVRQLRDEWRAAATRRPDDLYEWDGRLAMAERRYVDAIAAYRAADQDRAIGDARRIYELARAYDLNGQPDSALAAYERAVNLPRKNRLNGDYDRLGPTYKRLGELYEARGDREKAAEYYGEFVDLWNDADEELQPLVRDVRQRLARLVGER